MDDRTETLRQLMKLAGISSFQILSDRTGVSRRAIDTLRKGNAATLRYTDLAKVAEVLQIEVTELIATCITLSSNSESPNSEIASLREEYQHLQNQLARQKQDSTIRIFNFAITVGGLRGANQSKYASQKYFAPATSDRCTFTKMGNHSDRCCRGASCLRSSEA